MTKIPFQRMMHCTKTLTHKTHDKYLTDSWTVTNHSYLCFMTGWSTQQNPECYFLSCHNIASFNNCHLCKLVAEMGFISQDFFILCGLDTHVEYTPAFLCQHNQYARSLSYYKLSDKTNSHHTRPIAEWNVSWLSPINKSCNQPCCL